jgi:magnesium transporter
VIIDCAHYRDGKRQHDGQIGLDRAATICDAGNEGFVWIGMFEPSTEELAQVQRRFGLHDLAVEDAQTMHLRPKVDQYDAGEQSFVVLRTARYDDETEEIDFGEVSVFLGHQFVIAVRRGEASDLHGARTRLEERPDLLAEGPSSALWAIMDKIVDDYAPVVQCLERDIEELEEQVFKGSVAPSERIYALRREATEFYRAVRPLLAPLDAITRGTLLTSVSRKLRPFFRDVNDHLTLAEEEIVSQREALAVMLQSNLAVISLQQNDIAVRQNETSKQLTLIATVFLPLTFITGFFGMNFGWLVGHISSLLVFLVYGVGSLVVSSVLLAIYFRRRGWFGNAGGDAS